MLELIALFGLVLVAGALMTVAALVLLPLFLLFQVIGFGLRLVFGAVGLLLASVLLLPLAVVIGGILLLKLAVLAMPLLLVAGLVWLLVRPRRQPAVA